MDIDTIEMKSNRIAFLLEAGLETDAQLLWEAAQRKHPDRFIGSLLAEKTLRKFITLDPEMLELKNKIRALIPHEDSVLIQGETGTGKEILATALHGDRKGKFVEINCAAIPSELMEAEFFGYVKGAFTGALSDRGGLMQAAWKGTLFLDEVGELPYHMQGKLLRALQERKIRRVGENEDLNVDFRLVCATNKELKESFRRDLYFRIATFSLKTKPLRERADDIKLIIESLDTAKKLTEAQKELLVKEKLEGNVRELQNLIRRIQVFGKY